jgi:hypothetical protein
VAANAGAIGASDVKINLAAAADSHELCIGPEGTTDWTNYVPILATNSLRVRGPTTKAFNGFVAYESTATFGGGVEMLDNWKVRAIPADSDDCENDDVMGNNDAKDNEGDAVTIAESSTWEMAQRQRRLYP